MFPYPYSNPSIIAKSLSFLKNTKWGSLLDGAGKTLGVINQAIPIVYQVKPLLGNAKTLMKIATSMNEKEENNPKKEIEKIEEKSTNSPIFYI